jgi:hypothetical protein
MGMKLTLKACGMFLGIIAANMAASAVTNLVFPGLHLPPGKPDGPLDAATALIVASAAAAIILTAIAEVSVWRGVRLGLFVGASYFIIESMLSALEVAFFFKDLPQMPFVMATGGAVRGAIIGSVAAITWRISHSPARPVNSVRRSVSPFILLSLLYITIYWIAGIYIARADPAVNSYWGPTTQINPAILLMLQALRGLIWTTLAWFMALGLYLKAGRKALLTAITFAALMGLDLLYPNPLMPWTVRKVHLVEIAVSNFAFGYLSQWVFTLKARIISERM